MILRRKVVGILPKLLGRWPRSLLVVALLGCGVRTAATAPLKNLRASGWAPVNGARLHYDVYGHGPSLVFLHAGLADGRMWDSQVSYFSDRYTVVRFDARGYGQSDPPTGPFVPADDLYALLNFLNIDRARIVGLSMGGTYAIDFALIHPEAASALVIVAGSPGWQRFSDGLMQRTAAIGTTAKEKGPASIVDGWMNDPMLTVARRQPTIAHQMRVFLSQNAAGFLSSSLMGPPDIPHANLADLKMPTLVMVGDHDDPEIVERARAMTKDIPGAKEFIIKGADHMVSLEQPQEFNRALADFLRTVK
jgi:3-oxoadipate enol-lactonase